MPIASYMCGACDREWESESVAPTAEPCPRCMCETEPYLEDDMSDRLPGSSHSNPIWHGKWRIYVSDNPLGMAQFTYAYVHDDYDGEGDSRHGHARTVEEAKAEIDEREDDAC